MLKTAFGWCVWMAAFVNFCKMFFFFQICDFFENLRGYAHIKLYFPIKNEIGQNFRLHPRDLVAVMLS